MNKEYYIIVPHENAINRIPIHEVYSTKEVALKYWSIYKKDCACEIRPVELIEE